MKQGISRRQFAIGAGGAIAAGAIGAPNAFAEPGKNGKDKGKKGDGGSSDPGSITGIDPQGLSDLPVPFPDNLRVAAVDDLAFLDEQAQSYWTEYAQFLDRPDGLTKYDRADFWFRYLAIPATKRALDGVLLDRAEAQRNLGLIHRVGYYGGVWFFKKLEEFTGADQTARCDNPTAEAGPARFEQMAAILAEATDVAINGSDRAVLDFAENAIRDGELSRQITGTAAGEGLATRFGLIGGYSYNVGYTNAILVPDNRAFPPPINPAGPDPYHPPYNTIEFTPNGIFDCVYPRWADPQTQVTKTPVPESPTGFDHTQVPYLIGDTPAMAQARGIFEATKVTHREGYARVVGGAIGPDGVPYPTPKGDLASLAVAGFNTGTVTWTAPGLLDIRNWDEPSYHLIIALSIYFVQALQVAGCAAVAAAAKQDADLARRATMATAVALPFGLSYLIGAGQRTNPHFACLTADESIPGFTIAP